MIELPGDNSLHFYVGTSENEQNSQEKPFEIKLPGLSFSNDQEEQPEPFKINLTASLGLDENDTSNQTMPLKIPFFTENQQDLPITDPNQNEDGNLKNSSPNRIRKSSPDKKLSENSLNKSQSEKSLVQIFEKKPETSPKALLRRANSAANKRHTNPGASQDDSKLNYNQNPLDYIFQNQQIKKSESEKIKEFEDIPSPGEKIKTEDKSNDSMPRRLSNSLSVTISPKAKDSHVASFSIKPSPLNESIDSALKKYKIVMISKSNSSYYISNLMISYNF